MHKLCRTCTYTRFDRMVCHPFQLDRLTLFPFQLVRSSAIRKLGFATSILSKAVLETTGATFTRLTRSTPSFSNLSRRQAAWLSSSTYLAGSKHPHQHIDSYPGYPSISKAAQHRHPVPFHSSATLHRAVYRHPCTRTRCTENRFLPGTHTAILRRSSVDASNTATEGILIASRFRTRAQELAIHTPESTLLAARLP